MATKTRGRIYLEDTRSGGDGWTVVDSLTSGCMSFDTKRDAEEVASFVRAYLRKWGELNWDSFPFYLNSPPVQPNPYGPKKGEGAE
jgi:hypothetical protein